MSDKQRGGSDPGIVIAVLIIGYAAARIVEKVVAAITAFLEGLVYIALGAAVILVAYWVYRYIAERQFGEDKKERQVRKLEKKKKEVLKRLPKALRPVAESYYEDQQKEAYETKPKIPRSEILLDRTKQVVNIFRRDK